MKRGELKATCLSCDSEMFVLVVNLSAGQRWVLNCSPWQKCAVKAKVMVIMFALMVLIQLWWELCGTLACPIPSPIGVSGAWAVSVGQLAFPVTVHLMILRRSGPQHKPLNVYSSSY